MEGRGDVAERAWCPPELAQGVQRWTRHFCGTFSCQHDASLTQAPEWMCSSPSPPGCSLYFPCGWVGSFSPEARGSLPREASEPTPPSASSGQPQPCPSLCRRSPWAPAPPAQLARVTSAPRHAPCPHPSPLPAPGLALWSTGCTLGRPWGAAQGPPLHFLGSPSSQFPTSQPGQAPHSDASVWRWMVLTAVHCEHI